MASKDLNETKFEKFENEIKDEKSFGKKLNTLFQEQYKDNIDDILILKEEMFLDQLREGIQLLLEENYSDNCLSDDRLMKLITDNMDEIQKQYNHDYSLINKAWLSYEKVSKRRTNNEYLLSNFRKHCISMEDLALHNCCSGGRAKNCHFIFVYNADVKKEIKFVICEKCKKVYYSSFIHAYCNKCNKDYYTSLLGPDEDPNMLLATWENYHCPQLINEKMKCINCRGNLYLNMKNGILTCLNKKCEFTSKPSKIIWTCSHCNTDFKSEAIPYNPLDILRTQKLVEQTILLKHKAHPKKMPCCKLNVFFTDFFHKIECDGLLYEMELNDKIIVVCEKCNAINYYERFKWTCPKCGKRFRDKSNTIEDSGNNSKKVEDNNEAKDKIKDISKKNDTANKATKCYSLGKKKYRNSTIYSSIHRNVPKELFFNNSTIKDDKDIIIKKKDNDIIPSSPDISRHRKRYRTRVERELNLGEIKKIMAANEELDDNNNKEDSNKRLRRVGFHLEEPENKQEFNISYRKSSRFSVKKKEKENNQTYEEDKYIKIEKEEKEENEDEDTLKAVIENFPDKKDGEEPENNKMRKSNTNKNVFSRFKVDKKAENKDDKDKKEEKEEDKNEKNAEKNLSPRLMWKRRKQIENSKKQNILDLYAVNNNKKNEEREEKDADKDKNKEKDNKTNSGGGGWYKRRQEKRDREEKDKDKEEKEEKENSEKEVKKIVNRSPVRQYRNKHAKVFACEKDKEKEKNSDSQNNFKKEEENNETEDTKETEVKAINIEEEKEEQEDEKKEDIKEEKGDKKGKKIAMSKIPGVSEHLYNHINKRIQVILDRCKIPVFNVEDYMFDRKLGEGGYAIIFAVYKMDDETCKEYAMKKIIARTLNEIDKFTKEFELVHSCEHPNIMKIYGICIRMLDQTTYSLYVLMEISTGDWDSDIKKHLLKKKSYTEKELIIILRQLTDALLFLQQKLKISHRDIKPQNVLLFENGVYKLADFGEAKESKISKEINTLRGTELYMSPALYSGLKNESNDVNHDPYKSDVFSLGFCFIYAAALNFKLLYQLRDVYNSNQMNQILKQQLKKKYSDTFIDILSHMMEVDESLRYDFSHLMDAINANYDEEGNLKNPEKKTDSKRGFRKNK